MQSNKRLLSRCAVGFCLAASMFLFINFLAGRYPLGETNNIVDDEYLQYVDFFCYLKNVLNGTARLDYSITKSLGGNTMALVGYYLASPFNLLVELFDYSSMPICIFLITTLKISFASVTATFFFSKRFKKLAGRYAVLFGLCYAMSAYSIAQSANIMWLDGVYMLPLLMYASYEYVQNGKCVQFSLFVGYTIIVNWYTGYMNCLFSPFYYLMESGLDYCVNTSEKNGCKKGGVNKFIRYCGYELLGVALSSVLFLPVVYGLLQGKGAAEQGALSFNTEYPFLEIIGAWMVGNQRIWIYCSVFVLLLVCAFFITKRIPKSQKKCIGMLLAFSISIIYFSPISNVFNGFRVAISFKYRAAYITIMTCIYIAAYYFQTMSKSENRVLKNVASCIVIAFLLYEFVAGVDPKYMICSILAVCVYSTLLVRTQDGRISGGTAYLLIACVLISELSLTGKKQLQNIANYEPSAKEYSNLQLLEEDLIAKLKQKDSSPYRINSARTINIAKANSGMAYNYPTISHYDSAYDGDVALFLNKIGYSSETSVSLVDEPILPADALLGAKYLITNNVDDKVILGYKSVEGLKNEKFQILENAYALPMAFTTVENMGYMVSIEDAENPFELMNDIYSELLGRDVKLFKKLDAQVKIKDSGIIFTSPVTEGELYGYTSKELWLRTSLYIDERFDRNYGGWLYQPVYYVGNGEIEHSVRLKDYTGPGNEDGTVIYTLDMGAFSKAIEELRCGEPEKLVIEDAHINATITSKSTQNLIVTVPMAEGWSAKLNGQPINIETACGIFMRINIPAGTNQVELNYTAPWLHTGIMVSISAVAVLAFLWFTKRRKK